MVGKCVSIAGILDCLWNKFISGFIAFFSVVVIVKDETNDEIDDVSDENKVYDDRSENQSEDKTGSESENYGSKHVNVMFSESGETSSRRSSRQRHGRTCAGEIEVDLATEDRKKM